ncbi:uncharacterized, partial [Tachysurus ichikawai]
MSPTSPEILPEQSRDNADHLDTASARLHPTRTHASFFPDRYVRLLNLFLNLFLFLAPDPESMPK